ncbi:MAG: PepSY-like domain-containing protein [Bacteroidales bacterium]
MKKCMITLNVLCMAFALSSCEKEDVLISADKLPDTAKSFIRTHFENKTLLVVSYDKDFREKEYKASFDDGTTISFDKNGHWDEIHDPSGISEKIVPAGISSFVESKHADALIIGLDKNKKSIETDLNNGIELRFDLNHNFIGYTD